MDKFAQIRALVTVVETGSFSRAAERLGVAKSVLSRRLSALEQALGVQLLQRTTRSLSLTASGREFHARAARILADLDDAEQMVMDTSAALRGGIRLAAPLSFGLHHLSPALNAFQARHPEVEFDLDLNDREVDLVDEGFDMAVRIGDLRDSTLIARRLGIARFAACASPAYLEGHGIPQHPGDLPRHIGLHYSNTPLRQAWTFGGTPREAVVSIPAIRMRANNGDVLTAAAIAGMGILISPTFIVAEALADGRLVEILADYRRPAVGIHAVFPPGRLNPRRIIALSDFLAERFGSRPYWDRGSAAPA
jgi:DNA-binding transcriptional LysR family regulator